MDHVKLRYLVQPIVAPSTEVRPEINLDSVVSGTGELAGELADTDPEGRIAFEPGDVLFGKLRPYLSKSYQVSFPAHGTSEFLVMRPDACLDSRFLFYLSLSSPWVEMATRTSYGTKMPRTSWEALSAFPVPAFSLDVQRRIADFLDDQVSLLDRLEGLCAEQAEASAKRPWSEFDDALERTDTATVPLRRVLSSIADGPFGSAFSSADYVEDGHPVVRLGNIGFAEFKAKELAAVPDAIYEKFPKCHIRPGDLLIASLGDERNHAGRACVAPVGLSQAMVKGKCLRASVRAGLADAAFLATTLSSPEGADAWSVLSRGATRSMVNIDIVKSAPVRLPKLSGQKELVRQFEAARAVAQDLAQSILKRSVLLQERKQSLITAAVTGEFDVTTASSRVAVSGVGGAM